MASPILRDLRASYPAIAVVVLSALKDQESVTRAIDMGALGYIPKSATRRVTLSALQLVLAGGVFIPPEILRRPGLYQPKRNFPKLKHAGCRRPISAHRAPDRGNSTDGERSEQQGDLPRAQSCRSHRQESHHRHPEGVEGGKPDASVVAVRKLVGSSLAKETIVTTSAPAPTSFAAASTRHQRTQRHRIDGFASTRRPSLRRPSRRSCPCFPQSREMRECRRRSALVFVNRLSPELPVGETVVGYNEVKCPAAAELQPPQTQHPASPPHH